MNYKYALIGLCVASCLHGMDRYRVVHSSDSGKLLMSYWTECEGVSLEKVSPEAKRFYLFMRNCVQNSPTLLNLTPQELVAKDFEEVYGVLHEKKLAAEPKSVRANKKLLIEESARTIEGILNYLIAARKIS